jgi:signal transduction histidine kinase
MPAIASELRATRLRLENWAMRERPQGSRRWLPRPTVRLRLTLLYGSLFLIAGALLLAITYGLVSQTQTTDHALVQFQAKVPPKLGKGPAVFIQRAAGGGASGDVPVASLGTPPMRPPGVPLIVWNQYVRAARRLQAEVLGTRKELSGQAQHFKVAAQQAVDNVRAAQLSALLEESGIALGIMAVLSIGLGWVMAGRALAPVRVMNARARRISADNLHERLALNGRDDELKELGDTFDGLLERLERAFESQKAFVANASHELRTPLTVERTLVEVALADPDATIDSLRTTLQRVLVAGEQQERTIEALLTLARSQRGLQIHDAVDLRDAAIDALSAVDAGTIRLETAFEPASTTGDPALVERLVSNLVRNAVQHNRADGWAKASTALCDGRPTVTVTNSGPVVTPEEVLTLREPFRRLNGARTRHDGGIGLGLSIVDAIATAHGAELTVSPRSGGGLKVVVAFPASPSRNGAEDVVSAV